MSDEDQIEPSHCPKPDGKLEPVFCEMGVVFYPAATLDKKKGLELASDMLSHVDSEKLRFDSNQWVISGNVASDGATIEVTSTELKLRVNKPKHKLERHEERFRALLDRFREVFKPAAVLTSRAMLRCLYPIDGDARLFLGQHVMDVPPERMNKLRRPLHILGFRVMLPAFSEEKDGAVIREADWSVNCKVESWINDPSKLYIEAEGKWEEPLEWDDTTTEKVIRRLPVVNEYIRDTLLPFLMNAPQEEGDSNA